MDTTSEMAGERIVAAIGLALGLTIITTILDLFGFHFLLTSKNPVFFIGIGFVVVIAIWFGWKGVLAGYLGCFLGALLTLPIAPEWVFVFALSEGVQVAVPALAFRLSGANPALRSVKDVSLFLIFGCILNTILSGLIGTYVLCTTGVTPAGQFISFFEMWIVGDMMAIFIISTILLSFATPYMRAKGWIS
ncbi:MAG TPA: hypothetical protein VN429_11240 [Methanospirillum sp.]|uniref:hypothetical protein n=1 Tax=Methanospirillum sp. TaxID=45200 RepID=UPI002C5CB6A2|nr:hypothetical protein [Methanospirillum sp.]HWQ64982.1 hypothetical protein [Methanospirillum sp.]